MHKEATFTIDDDYTVWARWDEWGATIDITYRQDNYRYAHYDVEMPLDFTPDDVLRVMEP